jgi:ribosome-associated protein
VETAVIAYLSIDGSMLLTDEQKQLVKEKLANRINAEGMLFVKSQAYRTQLENKEEATRKINELVQQALVKQKKRKATKIPKQVKEKRLESKRQKSEIKGGRKKIKRDHY